MNSKNVYDLFHENAELKKIIDKYHLELRLLKNEILKLKEENEILKGLKNER